METMVPGDDRQRRHQNVIHDVPQYDRQERLEEVHQH